MISFFRRTAVADDGDECITSARRCKGEERKTDAVSSLPQISVEL